MKLVENQSFHAHLLHDGYLFHSHSFERVNVCSI